MYTDMTRFPFSGRDTRRKFNSDIEREGGELCSNVSIDKSLPKTNQISRLRFIAISSIWHPPCTNLGIPLKKEK